MKQAMTNSILFQQKLILWL